MLILVVVTINVALNGGIFEKANDATKQMEEKTIYEQIVGAMQLTNAGKIDVKGTYEVAKADLELQGKTVTPTSPATGSEITDATASITFEVKGKNGTYTYTITREEIIIGGDSSSVGNDFEIEVSQNSNGVPVESVTLNITPIIPDSWTPKYSEDEAVVIVAKNMFGEETTITTLKQLDLELYNAFTNIDETENPFYGLEQATNFDDLAQKLSSEIGKENPTEQEIMAYLLNVMGAPYTTIEEWAQDSYKYEAKTKKLKINGEEVSEGVSWEGNNATYTVTKNGTYEIQLELDGKTSTKIVEIAEIVEIKYVQYDGKLWIVLYDEGELGEGQGAQIISAETLEVNNVSLGSYDPEIIESEVEEFDGTEGLSSLEKSVYSYNNAIKTLNSKCESLVTTKQGITTGVRSVGSNPTSPYSENTTPYTSENLAKWPENHETQAAGIANGKGYSTDENYVSDYNKMEKLGIKLAENSEEYWLASRLVDADVKDWVYFKIRYVSEGGNLDSAWGLLWYVNLNDDGDQTMSLGVRPVISLESGILDNVSGTGTADKPYILQ